MNIGTLELAPTAALAPMAGVGDRAFREICVEQGAAYVVGEMCSAKGLIYDSEKSKELLYTSSIEQPAAVQLFAEDPESMAQGVAICQQVAAPCVIDINMGCPAPKITGGGSGSALMKNLPLAQQIIAAAVGVAQVPVTVKFRIGWDEEHINVVEAAKRAQEAGAAAITVHGRTKAQMYSLPIHQEVIAQVKQAVTVPVIANGGITTVHDVVEMYQQTGCDLVMIGQGALGRPWIFRQVATYLTHGRLLPEPPLEEQMQLLYRQVEKAVEYKGERIALKEARTHAAHYIRGLRGAAALRHQTGSIATLADLRQLITLVLNQAFTGNQ